MARTAHGMPELIEAVVGVASGAVETRPHRIRASGQAASSVDELASMIEAVYPGLPNARWVALRLLEGDKRVEDAFATGEFAELSEAARLGSASAAGRTS